MNIYLAMYLVVGCLHALLLLKECREGGGISGVNAAAAVLCIYLWPLHLLMVGAELMKQVLTMELWK